jgi:hypothetical protein
MRTNIPGIFALVLFLLLILGTGCVTQSFPGQDNGAAGTAPQDSRLPMVPVSSGNVRISYEEATAQLADFRIHALNEPGNATIVHYMRARDLDESGNATGWIFGVSNDQGARFLIYDRLGWTTMMNATVPTEAIALDTIVSPAVLFDTNKDLLGGKSSLAIPERRDIELQRGMYELTLTSGSTSRTLTFNATTGALIP